MIGGSWELGMWLRVGRVSGGSLSSDSHRRKGLVEGEGSEEG